MSSIKLSIITSTLNSSKSLPKLIETLRKSSIGLINTEFEWIIVDGKSNDATIEILNTSSDIVSKYITESDSGIYEAWNKGLSISRGEYVTFIGSDDYINSKYLQNAIMAINTNKQNYNVIAFKIAFVQKCQTVSLKNVGPWSKPWNYPINLGFYHPGTLFNRNLFNKRKFDESFKLAGDTDHLTYLSSILNPVIINTTDPMIYFSLAGISNRKRQIAYKEVIKVIWRHRSLSIYSYVKLFELLIKYPFRARDAK